MIRAALSSAALLGAPTDKILRTALAAGVRGIEWSSDGSIEPGDIDGASEVMMATLRAGLTTASYSTLFRAGVHGTGRFADILATARALQAPSVRLWAGPKGDTIASDVERFSAVVPQLADMGAREGISLCFGMGRGSAIDTYERAVALVGGIDHPFVKLCWEPLPGASFDTAMEAFSELSGRVGLLCARSRGVTESNHLMRDAAEDWLLYLDAFDEQGGSPDMARYVVIRAFKDGTTASLADDARLVNTWSDKLRRYRRRRLF